MTLAEQGLLISSSFIAQVEMKLVAGVVRELNEARPET